MTKYSKEIEHMLLDFIARKNGCCYTKDWEDFAILEADTYYYLPISRDSLFDSERRIRAAVIQLRKYGTLPMWMYRAHAHLTDPIKQQISEFFRLPSPH